MDDEVVLERDPRFALPYPCTDSRYALLAGDRIPIGNNVPPINGLFLSCGHPHQLRVGCDRSR
jgi:hypothetical protein